MASCSTIHYKVQHHGDSYSFVVLFSSIAVLNSRNKSYIVVVLRPSINGCSLVTRRALRSKLSKTSYIQRANDRQNTVSKEKQSKGKERKSKAKQRKAKSEYLWGTLFAGCPSPSHQSLRVLGRQFVWLAWFPAALNSIGALVESPPLAGSPSSGHLGTLGGAADG